VPEDDALSFSDHLAQLLIDGIVDQGAIIRDEVGKSVRIDAQTAQALAVALGVETNVSVELKVIRARANEGLPIQLGLDETRAMWVEFIVALAGMYEFLRADGVPATDAVMVVTAVLGFCITRLISGQS